MITKPVFQYEYAFIGTQNQRRTIVVIQIQDSCFIQPGFKGFDSRRKEIQILLQFP